MNTSNTIDKIAHALAQAQASFKDVAKSKENTYDRYRYAQLEDYRDAIVAGLGTFGLSITTSVDEITRLEDRPTKNGGTEHAVQVKLTQRIIHESGEWIETVVYGEGQDRGDKAIYKAITGARKYGLAAALNLATSDDPENDDQPPKPKQQAQPPAAKQPPNPQTTKPAAAPAPTPAPTAAAPAPGKHTVELPHEPAKPEPANPADTTTGAEMAALRKAARDAAIAAGIKDRGECFGVASAAVGRTVTDWSDLSADELRKAREQFDSITDMMQKEAA